LFTNRKKAIIFQNLYVLFQVGYLATMKHALNTLKVNPLDQVIWRNIFSSVSGLAVGLATSQSFSVQPNMRCMLLTRSLLGVFGNTVMTFAIALVPLIYQQTIGATVPFWAAILGFCMIGETIGTCTKYAMVISFAFVVLIAFSPYILGDGEVSVSGTELAYGIESQGFANLLGSLLILINAICNGAVSVATRLMQKMNWSVILFYYSVVALVTVTIVYLATAGEFSRIYSYNAEQYKYIVITSCLNVVSLSCRTISNQNEKSGIISMIGYIGIVYACLFDFFVFDESMNWLEWLGVAGILTTTITLTAHLIAKNDKSMSD